MPLWRRRRSTPPQRPQSAVAPSGSPSQAMQEIAVRAGDGASGKRKGGLRAASELPLGLEAYTRLGGQPAALPAGPASLASNDRPACGDLGTLSLGLGTKDRYERSIAVEHALTGGSLAALLSRAAPCSSRSRSKRRSTSGSDCATAQGRRTRPGEREGARRRAARDGRHRDLSRGRCHRVS